MRNVKICLILILCLALIACNTEPAEPTEYLSGAGCTSTGDIYFTIHNAGNSPLSLSGFQVGQETLTVEANNVVLTALASYCGRTTLEPKETVKCRRLETSQNDAGVMVKTGRELLFLKASNVIRTKVSDTTKEVHVKCS